MRLLKPWPYSFAENFVTSSGFLSGILRSIFFLFLHLSTVKGRRKEMDPPLFFLPLFLSPSPLFVPFSLLSPFSPLSLPFSQSRFKHPSDLLFHPIVCIFAENVVQSQFVPLCDCVVVCNRHLCTNKIS